MIQSLRKDGLQGGRPRESYEFRCLLVDPTWTHDPKEVGPKQSFDSQDEKPMVLRKNWAGRSQCNYLGKSHFPQNPKLAFCECTALLHVPQVEVFFVFLRCTMVLSSNSLRMLKESMIVKHNI